MAIPMQPFCDHATDQAWVMGQIVGNVGAYGNVGAVRYLTIYSLLPQGVEGDRMFVQLLGVCALIVASLNAFPSLVPVALHAITSPEEHWQRYLSLLLSSPAFMGRASPTPPYPHSPTPLRVTCAMCLMRAIQTAIPCWQLLSQVNWQ